MNYAHKFSSVFFSMLDIYADVIEAARLSGNIRLAEIMLAAANEQVSNCGFSSPGLVKRLVDLADLYHCLEKLTEARLLYQRALQMTRRIATRDEWNEARISDGLAQIYLRLGQIDRAEPLSVRSLKLFERCLGQRHHLLTTRVLRLAWIKTSLKQFDEATKLAQRARLLSDCEHWKRDDRSPVEGTSNFCPPNNSHISIDNDKSSIPETGSVALLSPGAD